MEFTGKLIVFSGPSGSGKTSIVRSLLQKYPHLFDFSISATTREKRANELDGKDYYFISKEVFQKKINNNEFVEWEEVYEGLYYGTLKSEIQRIHQQHKHILFDIDVEGGLKIKSLYPDQTLAIFISPPDMSTLEKRLHLRNTENEETFKKRINKAHTELKKARFFDIVIINDDLQKATLQAEKAIMDFIY